MTDAHANAALAWVTSKSQADAAFATSDATNWDAEITAQALAVDQFAHADNSAVAAQNDAGAMAESANMVAGAAADVAQQNADAAAEGNFGTAEANQETTSLGSFSQTLGTPWAAFEVGLAGAKAGAAATKASDLLQYVQSLGSAEIYHSKALTLACAALNIQLLHRPPRDPPAGGLIELPLFCDIGDHDCHQVTQVVKGTEGIDDVLRWAQGQDVGIGKDRCVSLH
ncbi:MAG TPA: hypothetical protein VMV69_03955 [Pirellulales bacterium]|nr:hypothetical protein [Pirellulales bacterium]